MRICRLFLDVVLKTDFYVNRDTYWIKKKFQKKLFNRFRILGKSFSAFGRKNFRRDFQKCILRVQRNNLNIVAFLKNWQILFTFGGRWNVFGLPAKFFWHDCHNCILHVHWNTLRKKCNLEIFHVFLPFQGNGRPFLSQWQTLLTWLSKLLSTCRLAHFGENYFFWTK